MLTRRDVEEINHARAFDLVRTSVFRGLPWRAVDAHAATAYRALVADFGDVQLELKEFCPSSGETEARVSATIICASEWPIIGIGNDADHAIRAVYSKWSSTGAARIARTMNTVRASWARATK